MARPNSVERASIVDLGVTLGVARETKVILFSSEQALTLKPALDRLAEDLAEHRLPSRWGSCAAS